MTAQTIDDVVARLREMQEALQPSDGVRWFNRLYLDITLAIRRYCRSGKLEAPPFLERLDVHFGNVYFAAFAAAERGSGVPRHWAPLFDARHDRRVAPLQFALAGLNSHVSYDLSVGVVEICESLSIEPDSDGPQHHDYEAVNAILGPAESQSKRWLLTGAVEELDHTVAPVDDALAIWSIERARDAAWTRGQVLWHLRERREVLDAYLETLDATVEMEGRALLMPHPALPRHPLGAGARLVHQAVAGGVSLLSRLARPLSSLGR